MIQQDNYFGYRYIDLYATPEQVKLAKEFAPKYARSVVNHYAKTRGQSDVNLIATQAIPSKIFEFMIYNYLSKHGQCSEPDIEIYSGKKKSFDCDLNFSQSLPNGDTNDYKIHVKSQDHSTIRNKDYISWGFQMSDPLYTNPTEQDFVMTGIWMDDEVGRLLVKRYAQDVMHLAADPVKLAFKNNKKFLYLKDVVKHTDPLGPRKR